MVRPSFSTWTKLDWTPSGEQSSLGLPARRQHQKRRGGDEGLPQRIDVAEFLSRHPLKRPPVNVSLVYRLWSRQIVDAIHSQNPRWSGGEVSKAVGEHAAWPQDPEADKVTIHRLDTAYDSNPS